MDLGRCSGVGEVWSGAGRGGKRGAGEAWRWEAWSRGSVEAHKLGAGEVCGAREAMR